VKALAGFVARFLDQLEVDSAHLVGHSLGGAIAAQMALDAPARAASLALVCSAGLGDEIASAYIDGFVAAASRRELKPVLEMLFADASLVSRQMVDDVLKYKRLDGVDDLLRRLGGELFGGGRQAAQPARELASVGKPVLVLWGKDDRVIPAAHAANAPRGAVVKVLDGAGHMLMMEKANEVNAALKQHIGA
jgi:pyruvate dehydrogenase E2 component (dihydrolipoamide acetyltransferase)